MGLKAGPDLQYIFYNRSRALPVQPSDRVCVLVRETIIRFVQISGTQAVEHHLSANVWEICPENSDLH